MKKEAA